MFGTELVLALEEGQYGGQMLLQDEASYGCIRVQLGLTENLCG